MTSTVIRLNEQELELLKGLVSYTKISRGHVLALRLEEKLERALFACGYQKGKRYPSDIKRARKQLVLSDPDFSALRQDFGSSNSAKGRPAYLIKNKKHEED